MFRRFLPLFVLPLLALPAWSDAFAQSAEPTACGNRDEMISHLSGKYSEETVAMGLAANGAVIEVLSSKSGASFTIVYTTPQGLTCLMAAGDNWEFIRGKSNDVKT